MPFKPKVNHLYSPLVIITLITFFLCIKIEAFKDYRWGKPISSDVIFYYEYLPATFIYKDLSLKFSDTASKEVREHIWYVPLEDGSRVIKTTMGVAFFLAPGFFIAHELAPSLGYEANGFTLPYQLSILFTSVFYSVLSMLILTKTLRRYFVDWVVSLVLLTLVLGTNLFIYITTEPGMSHVYSFFLFCCFIELTVSWYEKRTTGKTILLGLTFGLIALVRPTNILIGVFFLFYHVTSVDDLKQRFKHLVTNYFSILIMAIAAIACWIPQMLYWKQITGDYLYFSYSPGERFYFDRPQIIRGLFSYRKGWLLYTPVMAMAIAGIYYLWKKYKTFFWPLAIFLPLNIYIIFSWWCWWYGGSFGQRPMIDSYPLFAFPMAALIYQFRNSWKPAVIVVILGGFIYFNQFQSAQYRSGAIHWDAMSKEAYWKGFGKVKQTENLHELLEPIDYEAALKGNYNVIENKSDH